MIVTPSTTDIFHRACIQAAAACHQWIGKADKEAADAAAVGAMRTTFNQADFQGRIVIGEGERDEAPMLFIGEQVGIEGSDGPALDIAVDPLEGTTLCAENKPGAICVVAFAPKGQLLYAPDFYMQKIAVPPGCTLNPGDLDRDVVEVAKRVANQLNKPLGAMLACVLNRPRHKGLIDALTKAGVTISLISDGDVVGALRVALDQDHPAKVDLYVGSGGAPEGVLAATGLSALGGQMLGRLIFDNDLQRERAMQMGLKDPTRIFTGQEMAGDQGVLVATGVTAGELLDGVEQTQTGFQSHSVVIDKNGLRFSRDHTDRP